jgi:hypothetical protein
VIYGDRTRRRNDVPAGGTSLSTPAKKVTSLVLGGGGFLPFAHFTFFQVVVNAGSELVQDMLGERVVCSPGASFFPNGELAGDTVGQVGLH